MTSSFELKNLRNSLLDALSARRRELKRIRAKWGKPGEKCVRAVGRYFDLTRDASPSGVVDDKTWTDLEFPKIFSGMDSTETSLGSQYLYRQLRFYVASPGALEEHFASCEALRANASVREEAQLELAGMDTESNWQLASFIFGKPPEASKLFRLMPWWSLACFAALVLVLAFSLPIWIWLPMVGVNLLVIFRLPVSVYQDIESLKACYLMLRTADALASIRANSPVPTQLVRLKDQAPLRAKTRATLGWLSILHSRAVQTIAVWLNLLFLAELSAYGHAVRRMGEVRAELASTFESLGSIDAAIAVASYLECHPQHCQPSISDAALLNIEDGVHPLVGKPVANSICLDGRSALVTGSNMAGKTTFIKQVGINVVLGRTLGFCLARSATLPNSSVMALIRGEHSVESGESHYFAEIAAIRGFIEGAACGDCKLYLIDELFSGTNTVERLAAGRAVLECLGAQAQALVTTHDVELQDDVSHLYDLYYFQEDPDVDGYFDYRLRSGKTTRRNAIQLLARNGFPADLITDALTYSEHYAAVTAR